MAGHFLLILIGLTLTLVGQNEAFLGFGSKANPGEPIDLDPSGKIGINEICGPKHSGQITRVSTITWLDATLSGPTNELEAAATSEQEIDCLTQFREPVSKLAAIIGASEPDACNVRHISLVEQFHRVYIEPQLIYYKDSASHGENMIPDPLKWFFIHYATQLSQICRQNFRHNLELMAKSSGADYNSIMSGVSGKFIKAIQTIIGSPEDIGRDEDFVLMWNMVDRINRTEGSLPEANGIEPPTADGVRLRLKMKLPHEIGAVQDSCRNHLRPIYRETALSSMRLIDMGYNVRKGAAKLSPIDKQFQNWYSIVQACEYLLALKLYVDPHLKLEEMVVITRAEEEQMKLTSVGGQLVKQISLTKEPATFISNQHFSIDSDMNPNKLATQVRSNLKSRMRHFRRVMLRTMRKLVGKSQLKYLMISHASLNGKGFTKSSSEPLVEKAIEEETLASHGDDDSSGQLPVGLGRQVRDVSAVEGGRFKRYRRDHPFAFAIIVCLVVFVSFWVVFGLLSG